MHLRAGSLMFLEHNPLAHLRSEYAANLLVAASRAWPAGVDAEKLRRNDLLDEMLGHPPAAASPGRSPTAPARDPRRELRTFAERVGDVLRPPGLALEPTRRNLVLLGDLVGLDDVSGAVLQFLLVVATSDALSDLVDQFDALAIGTLASLIGVAIALPASEVLAALDVRGRLRASGLVNLERVIGLRLSSRIELKPGIAEAMLVADLDARKLAARFFPECEPPTLTFSDYAHLAEPVALARDLVQASIASGRVGINLLLHGATGTGKSELARLIAAQLGVRIYAAGRSNESGESPRVNERLSSLLLGHRLLPVGRSLLLFDELEDLFRWQPDPGAPAGGRSVLESSKLWFNELLEHNPIPTLWISNTTEGMDPAFLRRFAYAIEFRPLAAKQRAAILRKHLGTPSTLSSVEVDVIAERYEVSPAQLGNAVATSRLLSPSGCPVSALNCL